MAELGGLVSLGFFIEHVDHAGEIPILGVYYDEDTGDGDGRSGDCIL